MPNAPLHASARASLRVIWILGIGATLVDLAAASLASVEMKSWIPAVAGLITASLIAGGTAWIARRFRRDHALRTELASAEERWRFAMEGAGHGVWDWDIVANRVERSPAYLRITGLPADLPSTEGVWDRVMNPDDARRSRALFDACLRGELPEWSAEVRVRAAAGGWRWILSRGMVVKRDATGRPLRMIGTVTDIEALKSAERRLAEAEERWRLAMAGGGHDAWDWDVRADRFHLCPLTLPGTRAPGDSESFDAWMELAHPDDRPSAREHGHACARGEIKQFSDELRLARTDGGWNWVLLRGAAIVRDELGTVARIAGTITDLSAFKSAQAHARASEARLDAILRSAMDAIITVDAEQNVVLFNKAAERTFRMQATAILGQPLDRLLPERYRHAHRAHITRFGATGITTRLMGAQLALAGLRADGEEFPIDASISQVVVDGRKFFTVILRDITERKRAQQELRELSRAANDALEAERRRVARELHDELGQQLSAMRMDMEDVRRRLPSDRPDLVDACARVSGLVDMTVAATRRIASDLRPLMLDDLGLGAAIEWLANGFAKRTGLVIDVHIDESLAEVGEPLASAIFRIIQESLTNVARHAGAGRAEVRVERGEHGEIAHIMVRDDGKGITLEDQTKRGSFGLRGIRERAGLLGGEARIAHAPGGGTMISVKLPLAPVPIEAM